MMEERNMSNNEVTNPNPAQDSKDSMAQDAVKKAVKKAWTISLLIMLAILVVCYLIYRHDHNKQVNLMQNQKTNYTGQVAARDSVINEWISTFDDIENNIAMIKEKEKLITVNSKDVELSKTKKEQILDDITAINTLLEQNKKKIAALTAQLAKSGGTIKALETKIKALEFSMQKSENEIADLKNELVGKKFEITQLNQVVSEMQDTLVSKDSVITSQTTQLNKAFYVCGTFKELKAKGLLTKEGGFIGLGRTEKIVGNFSDTTFTRIDITNTMSIPVEGKTAKLISEHPSASYEFKKEGDKKVVSLEIKDAASFWKISKYAVVEVTR